MVLYDGGGHATYELQSANTKEYNMLFVQSDSAFTLSVLVLRDRYVDVINCMLNMH